MKFVFNVWLIYQQGKKMVSGLINANPVVYEKKERRARNTPCDSDEYAVESIDQLEIFDILFKILKFPVCSSFHFCVLVKYSPFLN